MGGANGTIEITGLTLDQADVSEFVAVLAGSKSSTSSELYLSVNGLSSNYEIQSLQSSGTSVGAVERTGQSQWNFDNQASTGIFVVARITMNPAEDKFLCSIQSSTDKDSTMISVASNTTASQTQLTEVSFTMSSSTYKTDTTLSLYKCTVA